MSDISKPAYRKFVQRLESRKRISEYSEAKEESKEGYMGLLAKRNSSKSNEAEDKYDMNAVLEEYFEMVTKLAGEGKDGE
jgi:hypothetical protein